ncbi:copper resistance protein B [Rhodovulum sp. DZ06]|uniref:copper resistance protein B n=1 Tax=Rhodovulum sp. DZ06 TaxID=3425126 RepID=UPI003D351FA6
MRTELLAAMAAASLAAPAMAEPLVWSLQVEQLEHRWGADENLLAWDGDFVIGKDELKLMLRSEAEYSLTHDAFETFDNQARLMTPISDFWDAGGGVMLSTPEGETRVYAVAALHGLAPQWIEVDLEAYLSDKPFLRAELDYEGLITQRLILTPSVEVTLPLADDDGIGAVGFGPVVELGARLSYDVVDRLLSPYVGVHYEQRLGEAAARAGGDSGAVFFVAGAKILF